MPRGSRRLPDECVRRLESAELILHAGDFVTASVLEALRELAPVDAVAGNMDEAELLAVLPERRVVEVAGARIGMVHVPGPGAGRRERLAAAFPGCDAVVYAHTHIPDVSRLGETWVLNPGSPTERRGAPAHSLLMLEIDSGDIRPNSSHCVLDGANTRSIPWEHMFARTLLVVFLVTVLAWSVLARGSEGADPGQPYRVQSGDTLWSIAVRHYRGDPREGVWRLQRENGLSGATLVPGQVLRVP